MRFHVFGLANIATKKENTYEPFTPLTWNLCKMLKDHGEYVIFYGPGDSDPPCDEIIPLLPKAPHGEMSFGAPSTAWANFHDGEAWTTYTRNGKEALKDLYRGGDISIITFGTYHKFVAELSWLHCEALCGYSGIFTAHKVFPSRAWMHYLYGELKMETNPNWYDCVIPHYIDTNDYPFQEKKDDYLLFMGRLCPQKAPDICIDIAQRTGKKLYIAGVDEHRKNIPDWLPSNIPNVEFLGYVGGEQKVKLLQNAAALLHPCRYVEPFGMVAIEALACGTPVIASDWGGLPEIIDEGVTGYLCRDMSEFSDAVDKSADLNPADCRAAVDRKHTLEVAYPKYRHYFERLQKRIGEGWYETRGTWRGPAIHKYLEPLNGKPIHGAEIGVDSGWLSSYLLRDIPNLHLTMVDPWITFPEDSEIIKSGDEIAARPQEARDWAYAEALRVTDAEKDRRCVLRMMSHEAIGKVADKTLDFVFIDAEHTFSGCLRDMTLWAPKLKPGGLLCGHDYKKAGYEKWGVAEAVGKYAEENGLQVELGADSTWFIRMTNGAVPA